MNATQTATLPALEYLQSRPQWVCWKLGGRKRKVKGEEVEEITKLPYNAYTGKLAESDDPATWASYERAKETREKYSQDYNGIGYMFNRDITGIDLDHCIDEHGNIDLWAREIIDLINSYSEISPSNTGIHILIFGLLPEKLVDGVLKRPGTRRGIQGQRHSKAAIEMYCEGRYFTVTGKHLETTPISIENRQEMLLDLHKNVTAPAEQPKKKKSASDNTASEPLSLSDNQVLDIAMKDGKFKDLWNGDTSGYVSPSEADSALCWKLAFYTGKDKSQMERLFKRSHLYREEKWDRAARSGETYGEGTLNRAIDGQADVYTRQKTYNGQSSEQSNQNNQGNQKTNKDGLPEIIIGEQSRITQAECLAALAKAHEENPTLFIYMSAITRICVDENNIPLTMPLASPGLRNELSKAANFYQPVKIPNTDSIRLKDISPPKDIAELMLALSPSEWRLLPLKALVQSPVLRPDGTILDAPGYDQATQLYYWQSQDMKRCKVPMYPTPEQLKESISMITDLFIDFPFASQADRANAIGLLFTPFVKHAITKHVQMALIDANNAGTGKGLLANIVSIISTGKTTSALPAQKDDAEWAKTILAKLSTSPSIVVIDNIRGTLESASLEAMFTADEIENRILGVTKIGKAKNEATWIATGNNLLIGGDLGRRCYRIRLVSSTAKPEERQDFKIEDLEQWTYVHRVELISAILTVARAWYADGKPKAKNVPNMGTFTSWAKTIGGILEYAGIEGFQGNRDELRSSNNEEAAEWEVFLSAWHAIYGNAWKLTKDIVNDIKIELAKEEEDSTNTTKNENEPSANHPQKGLVEVLPQELKQALAEKPKSFGVTLAVALGKRVQTVYGVDGFSIEKDKESHSKAKLWRVVRMVAEGQTTQAQDDNSSSSSSCDDSSKCSGNGQGNPPQPTATYRSTSSNGTYKASSNGFTGSATGFQANEYDNGFADGSEDVPLSVTPGTAYNYPIDVIAVLALHKHFAPMRPCYERQHTNWLPWYNAGTWEYQCGDCYPALYSSRGRYRYMSEMES